jgi:two-component system sensor histidine kinase YesM
MIGHGLHFHQGTGSEWIKDWLWHLQGNRNSGTKDRLRHLKGSRNSRTKDRLRHLKGGRNSRMKGWIRRSLGKRGSLRTQILVNFWVAILPLILLVSGMLVNTYSIYQEYDSIVQDITRANQYNMTFKEDMDETMYLIVVGSIKWNNRTEREALGADNPYRQIDAARRQFQKLKTTVKDEKIQNNLNTILRLLDTLEKRVDDILHNVEQGGFYDENIYKFNTDITILTTLIQNAIQQYIYEEASEMEVVRQTIAGRVTIFLRVSLVILALIVLMNIILTHFLTKQIIDPIQSLYQATEAYARGDFTHKVESRATNELGTLAERFDRMGDEIRKLMRTNARKEREKETLEMKLLTAQINPHFLYNTLDTIVWLTEAKENEEAIRITNALSEFFRVSLSNGRDIVTIEEEERHIRSYLEIQQVRFQDVMEYEVDIPENLKGYAIPKMTLQPIVENALNHGIRHKRGKGLIRVSAQLRGDHILLTVEDTGAGMTRDQLDAYRQMLLTGEATMERMGHGFGVANVVRRLKIHYGAEVDLAVYSRVDEGTRLVISLPKKIPFVP